jgi:2-oxoglutarate ferredoxin oxidoreductase subunit alpha
MLTGDVSYDAENHEKMIHLRAEKVARVADSIPDIEVDGESQGELLVLGWGSTLGAITGAVNVAREEGLQVSRAHLRHLNPFPKNLGDVLGAFDKVLLPEMNMGQLAFLLRANFLVDVISYTKVQGKPFFRSDILDKIKELTGAADVD